MKQRTSVPSSIPLNTPKRRKGGGLGLGKLLAGTVLTAGVFLAGTAGSLAQADGSLKWTVELSNPTEGTGGTPAIGADGTIYMVYYEEQSGRQRIAAVSPNGSIRWNVVDPNNYLYTMMTPAIGRDGTILLEEQNSGYTPGYTALNPADGSVRWSWFGGGQAPAVGSDGTLYAAGYSNVTLNALNPDGTTKWIYQDPDPIQNNLVHSPSVARDGTIYVPVWNLARGTYCILRAINSDGTLKWTCELTTTANLGYGHRSSAIGSDGTIYVAGASDGRLFAINPDGTKRWEFVSPGIIEDGAILGADGTIFCVGGSVFDVTVYALNQDGTQKWQTSFGQSSVSCPAVRADGSIVLVVSSSTQGQNDLVCLNPDGTIKWTNSIADFNSPTIGPDGTIYVQGGSRLYAINGSSPLADSTWPMLNANPRHTANVADQLGSGECVSAPTNLVSWWRAEGDAQDAVGSNHGTLMNGASFGLGEVGQAFSLDGTSNFVQVSASPSLDVGQGSGFSIETWIQPSTIDLERPIVEWNSVTGGNPYPYGVHLWISVPEGYGAGPGCLYANIVDTAGNFHWLSSAGGLITTNSFQHVALTYDKTSGLAVLYLNGAIVAQETLGSFTPQTGYNLYLGARPGGVAAAYNWAGLMDEVSLYSRALDQSEIQAIYHAGSAGKCPPQPPCTPAPTNLVSWWRAEGDAQDAVGSNHGTLMDGASFGPGEVGQAFSLNGSNSFVQVPASPSLDVGLGSGFSIEAWIKPSAVDLERPIAEWSSANSGLPYPWGVHFWISVPKGYGTGPGCLYANLVDTSGLYHFFASTNGLIQSNVWQHVAVTYDKNSGQAVLWLNGAMVAQKNLGSFTPETSFDLYLGARPFGIAQATRWAGLLDEVSLYSRALGQSEIQAIYNAGSAGKCP